MARHEEQNSDSSFSPSLPPTRQNRPQHGALVDPIHGHGGEVRRSASVGVLHPHEPGIEGPSVVLDDHVRPPEDLTHEGQGVDAGRGRGGDGVGTRGEGRGRGVGLPVLSAAAVAETDHDGPQELLVEVVQVDELEGAREGGGEGGR